MRGRKTKVSVLERVEGERNAAGEAGESWEGVQGGGTIDVVIRALTVAKMASLNQADPGQVFTNSLMIIFRPDFDINVDDRIVDSKDNQYVIQHVAEYNSHTETIAGITNLQ